MECTNGITINFNGEIHLGLQTFWFTSKIPKQIKLINQCLTTTLKPGLNKIKNRPSLM